MNKMQKIDANNRIVLGMSGGVDSSVAALLLKDKVAEFKKEFDPGEIGGTALLGISKPVIKAHGASDALAFQNALKQAADAARADFTSELEKALQAMAPEKENGHD